MRRHCRWRENAMPPMIDMAPGFEDSRTGGALSTYTLDDLALHAKPLRRCVLARAGAYKNLPAPTSATAAAMLAIPGLI